MRTKKIDYVKLDEITSTPQELAYDQRKLAELDKRIATTNDKLARQGLDMSKCAKKSATMNLLVSRVYIPYFDGNMVNGTLKEKLLFQRGCETGERGHSSQEHIWYICNNYNDIQRDVPLVAYCEELGMFIVLDGANRVEAERLLGYKEQEFRVTRMTVEEMAYYFAHQDDGKKILTGVNKFVALYKAGEKVETEIYKAFTKHKVQIKVRNGSKSTDLKTVTCIDPIYQIYKARGKGIKNIEMFLKLWEEAGWSNVSGAYDSHKLLIAIAAAHTCDYKDEKYYRLLDKMKENLPGEFEQLAEAEFKDKSGVKGKNGFGYFTHYTYAVLNGTNLY